MKNFFLGLFIGLLIAAPGAYAVGVSFEDVTVRDLFAAAALQGIIDNGTLFREPNTSWADCSYKFADSMLTARRKTWAQLNSK